MRFPRWYLLLALLRKFRSSGSYHSYTVGGYDELSVTQCMVFQRPLHEVCPLLLKRKVNSAMGCKSYTDQGDLVEPIVLLLLPLQCTHSTISFPVRVCNGTKAWRASGTRNKLTPCAKKNVRTPIRILSLFLMVSEDSWKFFRYLTIRKLRLKMLSIYS